jgi:hypothetical protein
LVGNAHVPQGSPNKRWARPSVHPQIPTLPEIPLRAQTVSELKNESVNSANSTEKFQGNWEWNSKADSAEGIILHQTYLEWYIRDKHAIKWAIAVNKQETLAEFLQTPDYRRIIPAPIYPLIKNALAKLIQSKSKIRHFKPENVSYGVFGEGTRLSPKLENWKEWTLFSSNTQAFQTIVVRASLGKLVSFYLTRPVAGRGAWQTGRKQEISYPECFEGYWPAQLGLTSIPDALGFDVLIYIKGQGTFPKEKIDRAFQYFQPKIGAQPVADA